MDIVILLPLKPFHLQKSGTNDRSRGKDNKKEECTVFDRKPKRVANDRVEQNLK